MLFKHLYVLYSYFYRNEVIGKSILQCDSLVHWKVPEAALDCRQFRCTRFPVRIVESWFALRTKIDNDCASYWVLPAVRMFPVTSRFQFRI